MQNNYIYTNNKSISNELCNTIVNMFEEYTNKCVSFIMSGINANVRDSIQLTLPLKNVPDNNESNKWYKIKKFLENELDKNLKNYLNVLVGPINDNTYVNHYNSIAVTNENFTIVKYDKQKGKYTYHDDFIYDYEKKQYRVISYLWYLNTVDEGGETEFWGTHTIKPEAGKLILFPASWTFPHTGKMPLSNDKYIITGWLHLEM